MIKRNLLITEPDEKIISKIRQRRLQILVHSCIYYRLGTSIISDSQFDKWAYELKDLQKKYPKESLEVKHYDEFKDWDASSGFNLNTAPYMNLAIWLVEEHKRRQDD